MTKEQLFIAEIIERKIWVMGPCSPVSLVNEVRTQVPRMGKFQIYMLEPFLNYLIRKMTVTVAENCITYDMGPVKPEWYSRVRRYDMG